MPKPMLLFFILPVVDLMCVKAVNRNIQESDLDLGTVGLDLLQVCLVVVSLVVIVVEVIILTIMFQCVW